ncbi:MAG TPA: TPM domain-containing protein [Candidatus Binatia bacterium]|nr:TPM domain-containing protein [Candidatus Binatia bacterium]
MRPLWLNGRVTFLCLTLLASLVFPAASAALELPELTVPINDFAKMMPPASIDDLTERLKRIRSETGYNIEILTVSSLEGEAIESLGDRAFKSLPLPGEELQRSVLLIIARKEQEVAVQTGVALRPLFPQPAASRKLQTQVEIYFSGMRPDLGIHAGVHYMYGVIQGDFRLDRTSEEEKLENTSKRGAGAGAIFAVFLGPFLAFFVGVLWGIYATQYGVQRELRLFIGAVLGGGTAQLVAILMAMVGGVSQGLWYFILALSVPLGIFGSLTEYWMGGDWSGIPRVKNSVKRKPEDNMGI